MANIIMKKKMFKYLKKYNCYIIYYAYGIIKVKYIDSLRLFYLSCYCFSFIMITIIQFNLSYISIFHKK